MLCLFSTILLLTEVFYAQSQIFECPEPWIEYRANCYKFALRPATVDEAERRCHEDSASLVSVNDREENEFIANWLRNNRQGQMWLTSGKRDGTSLTFRWEGDGSEIQGYQFWLPNSNRQVGDYLVYHTDGANYGWTLTAGTDDRTYPYICEILRSQVYMIINIKRGFDFGAVDIDSRSLLYGPSFTQQPTRTIYDSEADVGFADMECDAVGNPAPTYKWIVWIEQRRRDINPIVDPRYTITNGRLVIHNPNINTDNGQFQCIAENRYGSILSDIVQLEFAYLQNFPKSDRDPVVVEAFSGTGIECNPPTHKTELTYAWYKNSIINFMRSDAKPYIFISNDGTLYFEHVTTDDQGDYYCMIKMQAVGSRGGEGKTSLPIELRVRAATSNEQEPTIVSGFPQIFPPNPKKGDVVRIECIAWGSDELHYTWRKIGGSLPGNSILKDHNRVLFIEEVELIHGGEYECQVQRQNGLSDRESVVLTIDAPPYFTIPLEHKHIDEGADLSWQCIAKGVPAVTYSWYKNATRLDLSDSSSMHPEDRARYSISNNVLTINNVKQMDTGMYQCAAENLHAIHYSSAQLRVLAFPPTFGKSEVQPNTYASLTGNVTLVCQPEAAPRAELTWRKNGRDISLGGRISKLANGNLHITPVRQDDEGVYTCRAENRHGEATSSGNLTVVARTVITYYPTATTTVHLNRETFLPCQASYNPLLDVTYTWYQNGRLIEFEKIRSQSNEFYFEHDKHFSRGTGINKGGLLIRDTQFMHAGEYTCVATTTQNSVSVTAKLIVQGPPGPPAGVQGRDVTRNSIILTWNVGTDHGSAITSYIAEGYNYDEGVWGELKTNIRTTEMRLGTRVTGLASHAKYEFRMRAVNALGIGEPSVKTAVFTTEPARPVMYPKNLGGGGGVVGLLTITWDPMPRHEWNGEGFGYLVKWKKAFIIDEEWDQIRLQGADHNRHVVTVGSDNYYTRYNISIQAYNNVGLGPASPETTIYSSEGIPNAVPLEVRARPYNATALRVFWKEVPNTRESMKGVLLGYRINYRKEFGDEESMGIYNIIPGQNNRGLVIGLEPHTYYIVQVQAFNSAGTGPKSELFREETLRAAPKNQPTEVKVDRIGKNSVTVSWRGLSTDSTEEPLQGYMVKYWRQGESSDVAKLLDAEKITRKTIHNLDRRVVYNVRVYGYSRGGEGLNSSPTVHFELGISCDEAGVNPQARNIYGCTGCNIQASFTLALVLAFGQVIWNHVR